VSKVFTYSYRVSFYLLAAQSKYNTHAVNRAKLQPPSSTLKIYAQKWFKLFDKMFNMSSIVFYTCYNLYLM